MKAELKRLHSPDVYDLETYQPQGPFGFLLQMLIGPEGMPGEESFDTIVCSPEWMAEHATAPELIGDHQLVMEKYDYQRLHRQIAEFCQSQEGSSWEELGPKISKLGKWEFGNYKELQS